MYSENELVAIAKRENNKKRNYLVVDPYQGKHIPISPTKAILLFNELAKKVKKAYQNERILFVGFAETATAIGAQVAITVGGKYIQTTRECIDGVEYLFFSEAHSHATEQKLIKSEIDRCISEIDRIVFVEDEVTTGNTILNIVNIIESSYDLSIKFAVASLLNGMNKECLEIYNERNIELHYVVKSNHEKYPEIAEKYANNGKYHMTDLKKKIKLSEINASDYINTRRLCEAKDYENACERLWNNIKNKLLTDEKLNILVVGTEEFMYPALYIGKKIEESGCIVRSHSTTRSPILVSVDEGYPLNERFELRSLYDKERTTFIYNIKKYDKVIIITDAPDCEETGIYSLVNALSVYNNDITMVRWC